MTNLLAILTPAIAIYLSYRLLPPRIFTNNNDRIVAQKLTISDSLRLFGWRTAFGIIIGYVQYQLFSFDNTDPINILFDSRMTDALGYSLLVGLVAGIPVGARVLDRINTSKNADTSPQRTFKIPLALLLAIITVIYNIISYFSFINVAYDQVEYRRWSSWPVIIKPVKSIQSIDRYITKTGKDGFPVEVPRIKIFFEDSTMIDTSNFVPPNRSEELVDVLNLVYGSKIPIKYGDTPKL